jgi:hypothetical protein
MHVSQHALTLAAAVVLSSLAVGTVAGGTLSLDPLGQKGGE